MTSLAKRLSLALLVADCLVLPACKAIHAGSQSGLASDSIRPTDHASWLQPALYTSLEEYPTAASPGNEIVTFVFELPKDEHSFGHTGMAVGGDFYDFGPKDKDDKGIKDYGIFVMGGDRYWSNPQRWTSSRGDKPISYSEVVAGLSSLARGRTAVLIPIEVAKEHAQNLRNWWTAFHKSKPRYSLPGVHCTSSVIKAFEASVPVYKSKALNSLTGTKTFFASVTSPSEFAKQLLSRDPTKLSNLLIYEHRAGPNRGEALKALVVVAGEELEGTAIKAVAPVKEILAALERGRLGSSQGASDAASDDGTTASKRDAATEESRSTQNIQDIDATRDAQERTHAK